MKMSPSSVPTVPTEPTDVQQAIYFLKRAYNRKNQGISFEPGAALARGVVAVFMSCEGRFWCDLLINLSMVKPEEGFEVVGAKNSTLEQLGFGCIRTTIDSKKPDYARAKVAALNMLEGVSGSIDWFTEYKVIQDFDCATYFELAKARKLALQQNSFCSREDLKSFLRIHKKHLSFASRCRIRFSFWLMSNKGQLAINQVDEVLPTEWLVLFKKYLEKENS